MEENLSFEERWQRLLDDCDARLKGLSAAADSDLEVRRMWTEINRLISIMAIPRPIVWRMRRVLCRMAWRSSWQQSVTLWQFTLLTFLPRQYYRNVQTQQWFKQRLKANA